MQYTFFLQQAHKFKELKREYREHIHNIQQVVIDTTASVDVGSSSVCVLDAHEISTVEPIKQEVKETVIDADVHKTSDKPFVWPIERSQFWLSSLFGPRKKPKGFHHGIDLAALKRTPVKAAAAGIVERVYEDPAGYGKTIVIKHDETYKTRYAHLDSMLVKVGQQVHAGMLIGRVGDTGNVHKQGRDASHLHFEVYELGKRVNPMYFLS